MIHPFDTGEDANSLVSHWIHCGLDRGKGPALKARVTPFLTPAQNTHSTGITGVTQLNSKDRFL